MNKLLTLLLSGSVFVIQAHGQGSVAFNNVTPGMLAPVTISSMPGTFNPADGPPGAHVGSNYTASLFFVNDTVTNQAAFNSLNPIWIADAHFFDTTGLGAAGFFDAGQVRLLGQTQFEVTVQIRAWYNGDGIYSSYAQAQAAGHNVGQSNLLPLDVSPPPGPPVPLFGLQPFTVGVPEPSTFVLAMLGGTLLLLFRRRT